MIEQQFDIGRRDWRLHCFYGVETSHDVERFRNALVANNCHELAVKRACEVIREPNSGYTFTNELRHETIIAVGHATRAEQLYDTIQHELKHAVEHISQYYSVNPRGEEAAYLQGEIARQMYPAAAMLVCPRCNNRLFRKWNNST